MASAMAVKSRRLRFEILKRDGWRCKYCGAVPTQATMVVDHVIPESEGGTDDPANLVTACQPCNSGKSNIGLDTSRLPQPTSKEALHQNAQDIRDYLNAQKDVVSANDELYDFLSKYWEKNLGFVSVQLRARWSAICQKNTLENIIKAIDITTARTDIKYETALLKYFYGCLRTLREGPKEGTWKYGDVEYESYSVARWACFLSLLHLKFQYEGGNVFFLQDWQGAKKYKLVVARDWDELEKEVVRHSDPSMLIVVEQDWLTVDWPELNLTRLYCGVRLNRLGEKASCTHAELEICVQCDRIVIGALCPTCESKELFYHKLDHDHEYIETPEGREGVWINIDLELRGLYTEFPIRMNTAWAMWQASMDLPPDLEGTKIASYSSVDAQSDRIDKLLNSQPPITSGSKP